ncbi:hypothetical protein CLOM_g18077 [Closterium sp. NIES-68]|nr:hypothetical protein CLOM_g18077 [Closterium sp. NIES-68]
MDWLRANEVILDFQDSTVSFTKNGEPIQWQVSVDTTIPVVQITKSADVCFALACQFGQHYRVANTLFVVQLEEAGTPTPDIEDFPPQMKVLADEFKEVFEYIPDGLPPDRAVGHTIPVEPGKLPPFRPLYRFTPAEYEEAKQQIEEYLRKGWIEPSASPYGAPILFVNKKGGGLRMCVDYRALNKITIKNRYPLPRIEDLFDRLQGAQWFSALDLAQGYHQLRITKEDVPKTAFRSPFGHFQWRVLSFGLTNAPASFQRAMNDVFREAIGHFVLVYLDDILVYSKTEEEHTQHLKWVLGKLREHKFYARLWKCHFYKRKLEYLGHLVGNDGLKVDLKKVVAVQNWPVPQDVGQIRSFLGLANYFRRFLENYSTVVAPLAALTQKGSAWEWTRQCQEAFDKVKTKLTNAPVLVLPNPSKPYEVVTNASTVGIGAVLLQEGRPVAFESRKLSPAEQRYTTSEQELLAVVHALRTWRCYLEGVEFVVTTDHCPNTYFSTQATLTRRQARWAELLSGFTFDIRYRAGSTNMADPLSRQPIGAATGLEETEDKAVVAACFGILAVARVSEVTFSGFLKRIRTGYHIDSWFHNPQNTKGLKYEHELWWREKEIVVPHVGNLRNDIIEEVHSTKYGGHLGIKKTRWALSDVYWWPGLGTEVQQFVSHCDACARNKSDTKKPGGLLQPLEIPDEPWESVSLDFITDLPKTRDGHTAILVFVDRLTKMVHFFATTTDVSAEDTAKLFVAHVFRLHGLPRVLVSDRDPRFTSRFWHEVTRTLGTKLKMSSAFHPQTDGQTERTNRTLEQMLRSFIGPTQDDWDDLLPVVEFAVNNSVHEGTHEKPFILNCGRHPTTPATHGIGGLRVPAAKDFVAKQQEALKSARRWLQLSQQRQKSYADMKRREVSFEVGDKVLLSTKNIRLKIPGARKLFPQWIGPFEVIQRVGVVAYKLKLPETLQIHNVFHVSLLNKYIAEGKYLPPPTIVLGEELFYEVERVLMHRDRQRGRKTLILNFPLQEINLEI